MQIDPDAQAHLQGEINALRMIMLVAMKMMLAERKDADEFRRVWRSAVEVNIDTVHFDGDTSAANDRMRDTMALFTESFFAELAPRPPS